MADTQGRTSLDALTDVPGMRVGHAQRKGGGALTGTTVVLAPQGGAVAAVDVRGGGPGTRETDALDPRNLVQRIDSVVLTGGSAFGLDAVTGVAAWLEEQGRGVRVGPHPHQVVPVVPAACLFDLGRGGDWQARPDAALGREAALRAADRQTAAADVPPEQGNVGAGTGAVAGGLKGGVGTASTVVPSGAVVGVLVVVNAVGSVVEPRSGALYGELISGNAVRPAEDRHADAQRRLAEAVAASDSSPLNTTLAVVATDAVLSKAQLQKLAGTAHDGLARAIRPVHLMYDGDTVFALSTGTHTATAGEPAVGDIPAAAGDRATGDRASAAEAGVAAATGVVAGAGAGGSAAVSAMAEGEGGGGGGPEEGPETTGRLRRGAPGTAPVSDPSGPVTAPVAVAGPGEMNELLAAAADTLTRAVVKAVLAAESVTGPGGDFPSYRDLYGREEGPRS